MNDQILDEDEVLRGANNLGPSFWSDFKYFVWAFVFGMGMVYFLINLLCVSYELSTSDDMLRGIWRSQGYRSILDEQTYFLFPLAFILMLILTWFINRKTNKLKVLKYIYSVFGILIVHLLLVNDFLSKLILVNGIGFLLGLILICLSIFMLLRKELK